MCMCIYTYSCIHMGLRVYFLHNLMDVGSLLGTVLRTIRDYKKDPYVHPYLFLVVRLILTVAHIRIYDVGFRDQGLSFGVHRA